MMLTGSRNDGVEDRYSVLIKTVDQGKAEAFYLSFNGKQFSPSEVWVPLRTNFIWLIIDLSTIVLFTIYCESN